MMTTRMMSMNDDVAVRYETLSRHFKSGMLQGWNKFCFTGGVVDMEVQFPGRHDVGGLWPAVWLLGNLGRATVCDYFVLF